MSKLRQEEEKERSLIAFYRALEDKVKLLEDGEAERHAIAQQMAEALAEKEQQVVALTHELHTLTGDSDEESDSDVEVTATAATTTDTSPVPGVKVKAASKGAAKTKASRRGRGGHSKNKAAAAEVEVGTFKFHTFD